jgi:hypothetical protein
MSTAISTSGDLDSSERLAQHEPVPVGCAQGHLAHAPGFVSRYLEDLRRFRESPGDETRPRR